MAKKKRERKPNEKVIAIYFNTDNEIDRAIVDALSAMDKSDKQKFMRRAIYDGLWPPEVEQQEVQQEAQQEVPEIDLQPVLDAIAKQNEDLASVKQAIKTLTWRGVAPQQGGTTVMPGGIEATLEEIDPNADTKFLKGLRNNTFKPGMRLDD